MTHVKNAVSYSRLVDICTGYGGTYNPGRPTLQLKAMRALLEEAQSSLQDVSQKRNVLSGITYERSQAFVDLQKLASRIIGTLKASQAPAEKLAFARYYTRLINGRLKGGTNRQPVAGEDNEAGEEKAPLTRITQQSYEAKAHNFMRLANLIQEETSYKTASAELQPPALLEKAAQLKALNDAWHQAKVALSNARIRRNVLFYKGEHSLLSNASAVRSYVRVEFGPNSQQAAQLYDLRFTKMKIR